MLPQQQRAVPWCETHDEKWSESSMYHGCADWYDGKCRLEDPPKHWEDT